MEDSEHRVKTIILFCPQMQPVAFIWAITKDHPELTKIDKQIDANCLKNKSLIFNYF